MKNRLAVSFSPENTLLVTNSMLQFLLLGMLNIAFIVTTEDNWTYTLAMASLVLVITTHVLLPATYETSDKTRGLYFDSIDRYNEPVIAACCLTFLSMIYELIKQKSLVSYLSTVVLVNIVWKYLKQYLIERTTNLYRVDPDRAGVDQDSNEDLDSESNATPSDSLSEIDNVNSDTNPDNNQDENNQDENNQEENNQVEDETKNQLPGPMIPNEIINASTINSSNMNLSERESEEITSFYISEPRPWGRSLINVAASGEEPIIEYLHIAKSSDLTCPPNEVLDNSQSEFNVQETKSPVLDEYETPVNISDVIQPQEQQQPPEDTKFNIKEKEFEMASQNACGASQSEIINIVMNNIEIDSAIQALENQKEILVEFVDPRSADNSGKPNNVVLAQYGYCVTDDENSRRSALLEAIKDYDIESVLQKLRILAHFQVPPQSEEMNSDIEYLEMNCLVATEQIPMV